MRYNSGITEPRPDQEIIEEIGRRVARYRLNRNMTQAALATEAGVSRATVSRLEQGASTTLSNLVRVLRVLNLTKSLDMLVPEPPLSPIQQVETKRKGRQRASGAASPAPPTPWKWGDEE